MTITSAIEAAYQVSNLDLARIGIDNALATATTLESRRVSDDSDNENAGFPVVNVTRRNTHETYRPTTWSPKIYAAWSSPVTVNYLAIARHNIGSAGISGGSLYVTPTGGSNTKVLEWDSTRDQPVLFPFAPTEIEAAEVRFGTGAPTIVAVVHLGLATIMERPLRSSMQPVWLSRQTNVVTQMSEGGEVLGSVLVRRGASVSPSWSNLSKSFYNGTLRDLAETMPGSPFFFAWQPDEHPGEVVYGNVDGDPGGGHSRNSTRYGFEFSMRGAAL